MLTRYVDEFIWLCSATSIMSAPSLNAHTCLIVCFIFFPNSISQEDMADSRDKWGHEVQYHLDCLP